MPKALGDFLVSNLVLTYIRAFYHCHLQAVIIVNRLSRQD